MDQTYFIFKDDSVLSQLCLNVGSSFNKKISFALSTLQQWINDTMAFCLRSNGQCLSRIKSGFLICSFSNVLFFCYKIHLQLMQMSNIQGGVNFLVVLDQKDHWYKLLFLVISRMYLLEEVENGKLENLNGNKKIIQRDEKL